MRMKKLILLLCAAAVALSAVGGLSAAAEAGAPEEMALLSETGGTLSAPTNVREENGFIVWDEVPDAYGYALYVHRNNNEYSYASNFYVNKAEINRLCYNFNLDFGDYVFEVCAFDEANNYSEISDSVTAAYSPTFDIPENVRISEESETLILWDRVEGAARYNIRIFNDDENLTQYSSGTCVDNAYSFYGLPVGKYWISIQSMDGNYNVSEWTQPILISYTLERSDIPQNVRLDESGENVIWDEVKGTTFYEVHIWSDADQEGLSNSTRTWIDTEQPKLVNWKTHVCPLSNGKYYISVRAYNGLYSERSEELTVSYTPVRDESIILPDSLQLNSDVLEWDKSDKVKSYWMFVLSNGKYVEKDNFDTINASYHADSPSFYYAGNKFPAGTYEVELFAVDEVGNYNRKTYPLTFDTVQDETVWIPEVFYKFDTLLWDYDRLRHENTGHFWIRVKDAKDDTTVEMNINTYEYFHGLSELPNGEYIIDVCVYEYSNKLGLWSKPLAISKHGEGLFDKENETTTEIETTPDSEKIPETDRITSITINPAFNMKNKHDTSVELDLTKIKIKAKEIYDEAGLKRAEEALGEEIIGNKHYNLLDLTLLYNDQDFSNDYDGLVQVIIPIPTGHRDKTFSCYRLIEVNGEMTKEVIPGEQTEDSYIIYLEHFSEYALVADGDETGGTPADPDGNPETPTDPGDKPNTPDDPDDNPNTPADPGDNPNTPAPTPGGNPSIGRPVTNPAVSTGTTNTENTDNSTDPADPKDEDTEESEPDETDEEGDVDADTDVNDDDEEDEDDEDNEPEDDGYDDTFSKDDTDGNDAKEDSPNVTPEAIARDENPGTGVPVNAAMIFGFLMSGAAACAMFSKRRK